MKAIALLGLFALAAAPAVAQTISDGDTLKLAGTTYRLNGIDAPEKQQVCADGWPAGRLAADRLAALTQAKAVECEGKGRDRYGRVIAVCKADGEDIGATLVREGFAWAFVRYSRDYLAIEQEARSENIGIHAHGCRPAWEWRAEQRR